MQGAQEAEKAGLSKARRLSMRLGKRADQAALRKKDREAALEKRREESRLMSTAAGAVDSDDDY